MKQLTISDLSFLEKSMENPKIKGSGIAITSIFVPTLATATSTSIDTKALSNYQVSGDAVHGFNLNLLALGSAAGAAAAAIALDGKANAYTFTKA